MSINSNEVIKPYPQKLKPGSDKNVSSAKSSPNMIDHSKHEDVTDKVKNK